MPLADPPAPDTRFLFRPVATGLLRLLRSLAPAHWNQPTLAGAWTVRDVVAHLIDGGLRRVSFHRDRMPPPPPPHAIADERDFVRFINTLNADWVAAARRFSPAILIELFALSGDALADWFERLPLDAPALFPVSWAGDVRSDGWFDIGREFTELWHHQQQIRIAVGAPSLDDARYLRAVLEIAVRGLPHAFRDIAAGRHQSVVVDVRGDAGSQWTLVRADAQWRLRAGATPDATTVVQLDDDTAWRLLFNALSPDEIAQRVRISGDRTLAAPILRARSVIV
jgi:uncharacterized protein (TIGR03083 family)